MKFSVKMYFGALSKSGPPVIVRCPLQITKRGSATLTTDDVWSPMMLPVGGMQVGREAFKNKQKTHYWSYLRRSSAAVAQIYISLSEWKNILWRCREGNLEVMKG